MAPPEEADALFRAHGAALRAYLVRFVGDEELAADLLQETFARFLASAPVVREARAWLFAVATNLAVQDGRTRRRRARLLEQASAGDLPQVVFDAPERALERRERERVVRRALATLSDRDRTVLLMREAGFTHREIAAVVATTTQSVGTLIARALTKLERGLGLDGSAL